MSFLGEYLGKISKWLKSRQDEEDYKRNLLDLSERQVRFFSILIFFFDFGFFFPAFSSHTFLPSFCLLIFKKVESCDRDGENLASIPRTILHNNAQHEKARAVFDGRKRTIVDGAF